jgi:hypothetical protein
MERMNLRDILVGIVIGVFMVIYIALIPKGGDHE